VSDWCHTFDSVTSLIKGNLQELGTECLRTDLVARVRRRVRASPHSGHRSCLRCRHNLPSTFPKPQFRLSIRVRTPTFQNYLVSILQELEVLSAVKCHGLRPSFSGLVQAAQLELVALFIYGLCVDSS
jgi:hypothetical protein